MRVLTGGQDHGSGGGSTEVAAGPRRLPVLEVAGVGKSVLGPTRPFAGST